MMLTNLAACAMLVGLMIVLRAWWQATDNDDD
jgi:hypothetical protein